MMEAERYKEKLAFMLKSPPASSDGDDTELQYSPTLWSKKFNEVEVIDHYFSVLRKNTEISKKTVPCELGVSYGESDNQKVDIFGAKDLPEDAPIFVFIHGGYWIVGSREESSHFAKQFYDKGIVSVTLGYDLVDETIRIPDIVKQVTKGIDFVLEYASTRKSKGVYICGHSAGGHLAVMALSTGTFSKKKISYLKAVILLGSLFELSPLLKHSVSKEAKITKEIADVASPITLVDNLANNLNPATEIIVVSCEQESPAFQMQSQKYEEKLRSHEINSRFLMVADEDHFSLGTRLGESDYILTKVILEMMVGN